MAEAAQQVLLAQARAIAELALANGAAIERERRLSDTVVARIRESRFFHLLVPQRYGGTELPLPDYLALIQAIAEGDASTGWCVNQAAVYATMAARADPQTAAEIWGDPDTCVANGPPGNGRVTPATGGHRLSGRWEFSSGCRHANWVAAATPIDGVLTVSMLPIGAVELVDIWQVQGLRGTGSFAFDVHDVFVPTRHTFAFTARLAEASPLYKIPVNLLFAAGFAAVALGNARHAIDAAVGLLTDKVAVFERQPARERGSVQFDVARAEATWGAARAYLGQAVASVWQSALVLPPGESVTGAGRELVPTRDTRVALRLAATHAIHCAADAVQTIYRLSGSTAIFAQSPMQRCFQDAHVITQQVQGRLVHYETVGQHFLGMDPPAHFF